LTYSK